MVQARIINETTPVEVTSENQETTVEVASQSELRQVNVGGLSHKHLSGRDLPDQHPINAITDLRETLNSVADKSYVYEQGIASDTWIIKHNLNKHPGVIVVDSSGYVRIPNDIKYDNENQITVYLISAFTGKAFLN